MSLNEQIVQSNRLNSLREQREQLTRHIDEIDMLGWPDVEVHSVLRQVDRQIVTAVKSIRYPTKWVRWN